MSAVTGSRSRAPSGSSSVASSSVASTSTSTTTGVRFSDPRLFAMAADAGAALRWDALWQQARRPSSRWHRRRAPASASTAGTATDTALFTREDPLSFSVLASALLRCSVQELRLVFDTRTSEQFADLMRALSPRDLRAAELVHVAAGDAKSHTRSSRASEQSTSSASSASRSAASSCSSASAAPGEHLAVTAVTLESSGVLARSEQWCFLEHIAESDERSKRGRWFTKTLLALPPAECLGGRSAKSARSGHDVLAGLRFEEEVEGRSTRVLFSGELFYDGADSGKKNGASHRQLRARLLRMAEWVERVAVVVRRRRLGIQVLADRYAGRAANAACVCCRRSFFLLARKRSCALCGFHVCERCSAAEPRETCAATYARSVITTVRVCDLCMVRVDQCRYTRVAPRDLKPARVVADAVDPRRSRAATATTTTGGVLTQLLQETMASASAARKQSVLSVIKYLVAQDEASGDGGGRPARAVTLTDASTAAQHFAALQARLNDRPLPLEQCVLANADTRAYPLAYPADAESPVPFPVPATEQRRVQLVRDELLVVGVTDDGRAPTLAGAPLAMDAVPELDIICAIACKEMACSGSLITLVDRETMHVVSSTLDSYARKTFPREQGFCAQTIMSAQPLLVLQPEADVRFARLLPVTSVGVRFYCGFPLLAADGTVIGSMCCVAREPRTLSQSQYTVMAKLAQTASRVVQLQAKARRQQHPAPQIATQPAAGVRSSEVVVC